MRTTKSKNRTVQVPSGTTAEANASFNLLLENFFDGDDAFGYECRLRRFVWFWVYPTDSDHNPSNEAISEEAFLNLQLVKFLRKMSAAAVGDNDHGPDENTRVMLSNFFEEFSFDYLEEILNDGLRAWINPYDFIENINPLQTIACFVAGMNGISQLISQLEAVNSQNLLNKKGGSSC